MPVIPDALVREWAHLFWRTMSAGRDIATYPAWVDLESEDRDDVARGLRAVLAVAAPHYLAVGRAEATAAMQGLQDDAERWRALRPHLDSADWRYGDPPRSVLAFGLPLRVKVGADPDAIADQYRALSAAPEENGK